MQKELVTIIAAALCLIVIFFLLSVPAWDSFSAVKTEIDLKNQDLAETKDSLAKISELQEKYKNNQDEIEKLADILPKQQDLASLLVQAENLAVANGLVMNSINFTEIKDTTPPSAMPEEPLMKNTTGEEINGQAVLKQSTRSDYKILQLNMDLKGSYDSFKKYLKEVEKNMRLMDIISLNLSGAGGGGTENLSSSFNVSARVYYQ
jgi:Tfp pilus assembly protein PilO